MIKAEDIEAVIREALNRHEVGRLEYGDLDLTTDKRDFIQEAERELLNCINYSDTQAKKVKWLKTRSFMVTKRLHSIYRTRNIKAS